MIIRSRKTERGAFWARWFGRTLPQKQLVLTEDEFAIAMAKERSRCDRRDRDREFALIVIYLQNATAAEKKLLSLCQTIRNRLRDRHGRSGSNAERRQT